MLLHLDKRKHFSFSAVECGRISVVVGMMNHADCSYASVPVLGWNSIMLLLLKRELRMLLLCVPVPSPIFLQINVLEEVYGLFK